LARKAKQQDSTDDYLEELKRKFARAQDLCELARQDWNIDQDYYDGAQWTDDEIRALNARKQPALVFNHVKPAINSIIGIVERGKTDPKAWGRTPKDTDSAEVATDCLRYVADISRFQSIRSASLKDMLIQGVCCATVEIDQDKEIKINKARPEAFFYDPFSRSPEFEDARFLGLANWMDEADAIDAYPDKEKEISESINLSGMMPNDTYMDRPKDSWAWADSKTRRLFVIEMWHKHRGEWWHTVFVANAILVSEKSQYLDAKGRPACNLIAQSAYVDRDNRRYGQVRDMRGPQDAINKGRSKAVHLLNVAKLRVDPGVIDVDAVRAEYAKPDGIIEAREGQIEQLHGQELVPAHIELLRDAKAEMQRQSPTPGIVGRQSAGQSGRAILAEQQAGMTEQSPLLGRFEDWTLRVYRCVWSTIKQYWTDQQYIRVTDDENAPKYIMMNEPALQMDPNNPGHPVVGPDGKPVVDPNVPPRNSPAQMDVDIIIDSSPDVANLAEEQFQKLAELIQAGVPIPPDALIEASSLPKKRLILDKMEKAKEAQQGQPGPEQAAMQAETAKAQVQVQSKQTMAQIDAQAHAEQLQRQDQADESKAQRQAALEKQKFEYDMARLDAQARADVAKKAHDVEIERQRKMLDLEHGAQSKQIDFEFQTKAKEQDAAMAQEGETKKAEVQAKHHIPGMESMGKALDKMAEALKMISAPRKLVKDPVTGEKRVEIDTGKLN